jgi:diacylglycerol kinase (ATP)
VEPSSHADATVADLLLVNPAAGGGRASEALRDLPEFARQSGWQVEICLTQNPDDLAAQAQKAAEAGRKRILVLGGDGTFQVLLNALAAFREVILGVIPAGGGNDLAAALGLPPDPLQAAALLLHGETCELDAVRVRTSDGKERLYSGGGGVGLDAEAARYASGAYRNLRGRLRYVLAAIRALFGFHALRVRIRMEGSPVQNLDAMVLLVGVLNTPSYGAGLCLAPGAKTDDGKLDLVLLDDLKATEILALLPALLWRGELRTKRVRRFSVERVWIETDRLCWFHGDGELLGTTPVQISVVPRAIRILRPARKAAG